MHRAAVLLLGSWAACGHAGAQSRPEASYNLGAASEYVFRGVSQTGGQPQVFGGADLSHGAVYLGAWASNVDYGDGTEAEVDLYGGFRRRFGGWTADVGAIAYLYPGQPDGAVYDYVEAKLAASRAFGSATVGGAVFWTPDFGGPADDGTYLELNGSVAARPRWTVSGAVGAQMLARSDLDYATWNLGLTWAATKRLGVDLRFHATDAEALGPGYEARVTGAVRAAF